MGADNFSAQFSGNKKARSRRLFHFARGSLAPRHTSTKKPAEQLLGGLLKKGNSGK